MTGTTSGAGPARRAASDRSKLSKLGKAAFGVLPYFISFGALFLTWHVVAVYGGPVGPFPLTSCGHYKGRSPHCRRHAA